jgi:GAF domain-containing protein
MSATLLGFSNEDSRRILDQADIVRRRLLTQGFSLARVRPEVDALMFVYSETVRVDELKGLTVPPKGSIAGATAVSRKPQYVRDAYGHPTFFKDIDVQTRFKTGSVMTAPVVEDDRLVGVLEAVREFGKEQFSDANFARFTETARQFEELIHYRDAKDVWNLCMTTFDDVQANIGADGISFLVWSERRKVLEFFSSETMEYNKLAGYELPVGAGLIGQCAASRAAVRTENAYKDTAFYSLVDEAFRFKTGAVLCLPLFIGEDLVGVAQSIRRHGFPPFDRRDEDLLRELTEPLTEIVARADLTIFQSEIV